MSAGTGQGDAMIGRRIQSYVVQRKLGEGGMGAVYEMLHPGIGKRLALKVLHAEYAKKEPIVQRFFAEARAVNQIGHPNIVDIINFDTLEDGSAFIMMEFLEGTSLSRYIQQRGPMSPGEMADVILPVCDALAAAHGHGITHRDLKPDNIQLVPRHDNPRYVKLLDFGIAKLSTDTASAATRTGQVMGTPTYMSPEQAMGRTREIDHRTDIYALGIIMYQMLTGDVPFHADSFGDLMLQHLQQTPPALQHRRPDLPGVWNDVIQICLAKNRDDRFASMQELSAAIRAALVGQPIGRAPVAVGAQPGPRGTMALDHRSGAGSYPPQAPTYPSGGYPPGSQPPGSQPGTGPGSYPGAGWQAVPPTSSTGVQSGRPRWVIPAVIAAVAAVGVVVAVVLGGGGGTVAASDPPDAGPVAATPPDAAPVAAAPPDAADVAVVPPDAAPVAAAPPDAAPADKPGGKTGGGGHSGDDDPKGKGTVRVSAIPWAQVIINGKRYGQTPVTATVPAGKKIKVQAINPELGTKDGETVILSDGETKQLRFTMTPGATAD